MKNFKIADIDQTARYTVVLTDREDGTQTTRDMSGADLVSLYNAAAHCYDFHAEKAQEITAVYEQMTAELEAQKDRSAWGRGVNVYALELVEELEERAAYEGRNPQPGKECREWMLNGAQDWSQYSWGGSALIYDADIAERLCTPSELKKTRNGDRRPNGREEWLDVQARALYQACNRVARLYRSLVTA